MSCFFFLYVVLGLRKLIMTRLGLLVCVCVCFSVKPQGVWGPSCLGDSG